MYVCTPSRNHNNHIYNSVGYHPPPVGPCCISTDYSYDTHTATTHSHLPLIPPRAVAAMHAIYQHGIGDSMMESHSSAVLLYLQTHGKHMAIAYYPLYCRTRNTILDKKYFSSRVYTIRALMRVIRTIYRHILYKPHSRPHWYHHISHHHPSSV